MKASMWIMLEILLIGAILLYSTVRTITIIYVVFLAQVRNVESGTCVGKGGLKRQEIYEVVFGGNLSTSGSSMHSKKINFVGES